MNYSKHFKKTHRRGFTLIEVMVSLAIFSILVVTSTASLLNVLSLNAKAQATKSVMDNLNATLDSMSRLMRTGTNFSCTNTNNGSCSNGASSITFTSQPIGTNGQAKTSYFVTYSFANNAIQRVLSTSTNNGPTVNLTSEDINIDSTRSQFYLYNNGNHQPRVLITIHGTGGAGISSSEFYIQTTVSERSST